MNVFMSSKVWGVAAALLVVAYLLAFIYWQQQMLPAKASPLAVTASEVAVDKALDISSMAALFGTVQQTPREEVKESQLSLKLVASYVVPQKNRSAAIISSDGDNQKLYYIGAKIQPGVELKAVQAGRILIKRNGVLESISLEDTSGGVVAVESKMSAPVEVAAITPVAKPGGNQEMLEKLKKLKSLAAGDN